MGDIGNLPHPLNPPLLKGEGEDKTKEGLTPLLNTLSFHPPHRLRPEDFFIPLPQKGE